MNLDMNLEDIFKCVKPNDFYLTEKETYDIMESIFDLIDFFLNEEDNVDEELINEIYELVTELIFLQFENDLGFDLCNDNYEDIEVIIDYSFEIFKENYLKNEKCFSNYNFLHQDEKNENEKENINENNFCIEKQIEYLRNVKKYEQRSDEWYVFRNNLISASNAYLALGSQCEINSLIYEKCMPVDKTRRFININTSMHHGIKFEPVSLMIYEKLNNTKVEEFGCIQHNQYSFLGASPDGIITDKKNNKYGRMIEIKNVVSRNITGIPKKEYFIQMQLQMECCNLDYCDFLETKFIEYENEESFYEDGSFLWNKDNKQKGVIILFYKNDVPHYEYKPIDLDENEYENWADEQINKNIDKTFIKKIFWKLQVISCVLIERNKQWFENNIQKFKNIWDIILEERISGAYVNRKPQKRILTKNKTNTEDEIVLKFNI
jgi:putative phage-type endonuclease